MKQSKGAFLVMASIAAGLAGFGIWQFGGMNLGAGEHGGEETVWREGDRTDGDRAALVSRIAEQYEGRIIEVEREYEGGREVLEVKLAQKDGRRRKLHLDPATLRPVHEER